MKAYLPLIIPAVLAVFGLYLASTGAWWAGCLTFAAGVIWWRENASSR